MGGVLSRRGEPAAVRQVLLRACVDFTGERCYIALLQGTAAGECQVADLDIGAREANNAGHQIPLVSFVRVKAARDIEALDTGCRFAGREGYRRAFRRGL